MAIPSGGLVNKYDLIDPACYVGGTVNDLVGTVDLLTDGSPTFDSVIGSITWNGTGVGAFSAANSYANITTTFTISLWVKFNDTSATQILFNNGERTSGWSGYSLFVDNTSRLDFGANFVWGGYHSCPTLNPAKWYNVTYTYENVSGGTLKFYIDGVLISTSVGGIGPANAYTTSSFMAWGGSATAGRGAPTFPNKASYGVVLIYNQVLNATQVSDIYLTYVDRFIGPVHAYDAADPASYPGSGSTLYDIGSGTAADLTITNATYDNVNESFALDGSNTSHIRSAYPVTIGIGANNFSIQYWFKYNGITGQPPYNIFLQVGTRGPGGSFNGFNHNTYNNQFIFEQPGVTNYSTGFYPTVDQWYQITQTLNSSNVLQIFVDGTSVYSTTISALTAPTGSFTQIAWGTATFSGDSVGNVDAGPLFIYDRVLNNTEITDYYNSTVTRFYPPPPPVVGLVGGRTFGQGFAG